MLTLLFLWALLISLGCVGAGPEFTDTPPAAGPGESLVVIGDASYTVDLAVTPEERQQGLSGREHMAGNEGMLFVFDEERQLSFWMKEMRFPLDIIWIDSQCRLIGVSADVQTPPLMLKVRRFHGAISLTGEVRAGVECRRMGSGWMSAGEAVVFSGAIQGQYGC